MCPVPPTLPDLVLEMTSHVLEHLWKSKASLSFRGSLDSVALLTVAS